MTTKTRSWPQRAMVGYVDCTATGSALDITSEQLKHYNVVIYGFAGLDGEISQAVGNIINQIKPKQAPGTLNLISIGGAGGTGELTPNTTKNILNVIQQYGLDGVDLDIEDGSITVDKLLPFTEELRLATSKEGYLLTAAPILAGEPNNPTLNIPSGVSLDKVFNQVQLDAILVQAYNSGTYFQYPLPSMPSHGVHENSANIISAAYNALQKKHHQPIHKGTQIVIGIPANPGGAPTASNCWNVEDYNTVPPLVKLNLGDIYENKYDIDSSQFGGLMMWSLNTDAAPQYYRPYQGYQNPPAGYFAKNVASLIVG
ncbi:hypothetical protein JF50_00930 [Pseudoalteromonas luteoviolacea]|uniref:chitinase n=1 Tax=Pseudoalteromonas luteoviolacea TaxID=43657 RepID=A0A0C1QEG0_9GAMM|nr:glycoside hydrolase family 18 protein [Pseudoalteromonas luteoviolacea]KID59051.1 hypothetical protein JF50_00930 [Pseudoalteromonas luteoviolacea]